MREGEGGVYSTRWGKRYFTGLFTEVYSYARESHFIFYHFFLRDVQVKAILVTLQKRVNFQNSPDEDKDRKRQKGLAIKLYRVY